jgi:thiol:disulfide interchange protein DsbD
MRPASLPALLPLLVLAASAHGAPAAAAASPWSEHAVVAARLIAAPPDARRAEGGELRLGLHVRLAEGWHVYWRHAGDAGLPPDVALTADAPVGPPRLLFPAPRRYRLRAGLVANGYDGEVVYPLRASVAPGAEPPRTVTAAVDYLACEDECIPFHDELELELGDPDSGEGELLARWEARLPVPLGDRPELAARVEYRGGAEGGDLVLGVDGATVRDVFVAPIPRVVVGNPRWDPGAGPARAVVPLRPETGTMPARLSVPWVATGVAGAGAGEAVEGLAELSLSASPAAPARDGRAAGAAAHAAGSADAGRDPAIFASLGTGPLGTLLRGAALAFTPGSLAVLLLLGLAPPGGRSWVAPGVAAVALAGAASAVGWLGRLAGNSLPLAEPVALATLAVPQLALALALWWGSGTADPGAAGSRRRTGVRDSVMAGIAALLALPFLPPSAAGRTALDPAELAPLAAGFGLAVTAAVGARRLRRSGTLDPGGSAPALVPLLGFLPAAALAWVSYRMSFALPSAQLGGVQLAWLGAALAAHLARTGRAAARLVWWALAVAALGASLWLAG